MVLTESNVADYADTLVLQVRGGGRVLDYSEESVATQEELIAVSDELLALPDFPETQRNLLLFYNGCYLGEVIARNFGGVWSFAENWFDASLICRTRTGGLQVFPFQKIDKRISDGADANFLPEYLRELKTQLL